MKPKTYEEIKLEESIIEDEQILVQKKKKLADMIYKRGNYSIMEITSIKVSIVDLFAKEWRTATTLLRDYYISQRYVKRFINYPKKILRKFAVQAPHSLVNQKFPVNISEPSSLEYLCMINKIDIWVARKQWTLLKLIIVSYLDNVVKYKPYSFEFKNVDEHGFPICNHYLANLLITLGKVSKMWRIILKSKCVWYGPYLRQFAFMKGSFPVSHPKSYDPNNIYVISNLNKLPKRGSGRYDE